MSSAANSDSSPCIIFFTFQHLAVCKQPLPEERAGTALEISNSSVNNSAGARALYFTALTLCPSGVPRNFVRGGVQQIQLRIEDRDNGDLVAVAP